MITDDQYKLIYYPKIDKTLLFDLKNDPLEMQNLADDPKYAARIKDLKQKLKQLQKACGDTLAID
jgi:arylsulfatase A-like enzyme